MGSPPCQTDPKTIENDHVETLLDEMLTSILLTNNFFLQSFPAKKK